MNINKTQHSYPRQASTLRLNMPGILLILSIIAMAAFGQMVPESPESPPAKPKKVTTTTIAVRCPECQKVGAYALKDKDIHCNSAYAVTNGTISQCSATVKCSNCKERFDTAFDRFIKPPPKATVLQSP